MDKKRIGIKGNGIKFNEFKIEEKADIIIIDTNKPHLCPMHNIYSLLAYSVNGADVETSIIDGRIVMENRQVLNVDENQVMRDCRRVTECLFR